MQPLFAMIDFSWRCRFLLQIGSPSIGGSGLKHE